MNLKIIVTVIKEYGLRWIIYRILYMAKLKMLCYIPFSEKLFEKNVEVVRIDIFHVDVVRIEKFIFGLKEEQKSQIVNCAEKILEGKIIGFSNIILDYGMPIDWQLNPLTGKVVNKAQKWYTIPDFDPGRGDIKVIWEASRFGYLFFLLRAYMITKDLKYYQGFSKILQQWLEGNKYSYGANFKCGQECTLRMMNVLAVYSGFDSYGLTTEGDRKNVIEIVRLSYKKVCSNFFYAHKCIKNDHTIAELCGMIIGSWCTKEVKKCEKYFVELERELEKQFSPHGMYLSYSFNYQRYVLQLMEYMLKVSSVLELDFNKKIKKLLYRAAVLLYQSQNYDGRVPNYGANDGTLLFPVTVCDYRNYMPVINTIMCLTKGISCYGRGEHEEELLWFSSEKSEVAYSQIERKTLYSTEMGVYHYRNDKMYLMINAHNYSRRPGHMDQLHIDLWANNKNVLCDSGSYSYAEADGEKLSNTAGHNTVCVENKEQMRKIGKFLTYDIPKVKIVKCSSDEFEASLESNMGYIHNRYIRFEDRKILIKDCVVQTGKEEPWSVIFHTPCKTRQEENGVVLLDEKDKALCRLICKEMEIKTEKSFASWYYLDKQDITLIRIMCLTNECVVEIRMEA